MEFIEAQVAQIPHQWFIVLFFKLFRLMDVDRDKHFSVSDLQALEEEDNRVSGQALKKIHHFGTGSYYCSGCLVLAFPLTSYLPTGSVLPRSGGLFSLIYRPISSKQTQRS